MGFVSGRKSKLSRSESIWTLQTDYDAYKKEDSYARLSYTRVYGCDMSYGTNNTHIISMLEDVSGRGIVQQTPTTFIGEKWGADIRNSENEGEKG